MVEILLQFMPASLDVPAHCRECRGFVAGGDCFEYQTGAFLRAEIAKWGKLIKEAGIRIE